MLCSPPSPRAGPQAECTNSGDPDFWARGLHPVTRSTPLQLIVPRVAQHGVEEDNLKEFMKAARWMMDRGADPHAVAPVSCTGIVSLRFDAKESRIEVRAGETREPSTARAAERQRSGTSGGGDGGGGGRSRSLTVSLGGGRSRSLTVSLL